MIDRNDQHRDTQCVREQDELLPLVGTRFADIGEELNRREPLALGEPNVAHEVVKVTDQRRHDLPEPWILAVGETRSECIGNALLIEFPHVRAP
jgi:hypothetical protein